MKPLYSFLDNRIFPYVEKFFANPLVILVTLVLMVPMIGFQSNVVLILLLNSYMNVGSFGTSQITLRQVILTADQQEQRSQETHDSVMEELRLAKEERQELTELVKYLHEKLDNGGK